MGLVSASKLTVIIISPFNGTCDWEVSEHYVGQAGFLQQILLSSVQDMERRGVSLYEGWSGSEQTAGPLRSITR